MKIKDRAKPALPPVPAGQYLAVCVGVYDLGEQYSEKSPGLLEQPAIPSARSQLRGSASLESVEVGGPRLGTRLPPVTAHMT